jgi:Entner-Doudoroff aldolase
MKLRTVAVLRGRGPEDTVRLALRAWDAGIDLVEVPVQNPAGWSALQALADAADGRTFGAGTVLDPDSAVRATGLGATVLVSPGLQHDVVAAAREAGALPLPGVLTPTDVTTAVRWGLRVLKLFPASVVGPGAVSALRGPFPDARLIAVGGVTADTAADYLRAGACGVGLGGNLEDFLARADAGEVVRRLHALADDAGAVDEEVG